MVPSSSPPHHCHVHHHCPWLTFPSAVYPGLIASGLCPCFTSCLQCDHSTFSPRFSTSHLDLGLNFPQRSLLKPESKHVPSILHCSSIAVLQVVRQMCVCLISLSLLHCKCHVKRDHVCFVLRVPNTVLGGIILIQ